MGFMFTKEPAEGQKKEMTLELAHFSIFFKKQCLFTKDFFKTDLTGWTWLHGSNGSGKSTFIRAMLGIGAQTEGEIRLFGMPPRKARAFIGYMPQKREDGGLFLPAVSHVEAALRCGIGFFPSAKRTKKAQALLEECGAGHLSRRPLKFLSGGERQKIALAQALALDPKLLVLDEPFIALDSQAREEIAALLAVLVERRGMGVFLATHEGMALIPTERRDLFLRDGSLFETP